MGLLFWLGFVLVALGVVLLGFSNPWVFFQSAQGSFFDWTEVFWYLQWGGFWLVTAGLLVFLSLAWKAPAAFESRWRLVPVGIASLLFVLFFVCSMPEKSNQKDWKNGWLGARVYARTKLWMRGDGADEAALPDRLRGRWEVPGGISFILSHDRVRMISPGGETKFSAATCRRHFQMEYDFTYRSSLERPLPAGLRFTPFDQTGAAAYIPLPDRRFPRLSCYCDSRIIATWVLVDIDQMMAFLEPEQVLIARRN